ncbi:hypothetical protein P3S67_005129 [Capsicum chacoense]
MKHKDAAQIAAIKAMQVASATEILLICEFRVFVSLTLHVCFDFNLLNFNAKLSDFGLAKVEPIGDPSYALTSVLVFCVCIILQSRNYASAQQKSNFEGFFVRVMFIMFISRRGPLYSDDLF